MSFIEIDGHELPDHVRIGPVYYEIVIGKCEANWAVTQSDELRITIDPELSGEKAKEILVHEFCHAINNTYLPVVVNQDGFRAKIRPRDLDEIFAGAYGYGWLGFMRDNPVWVLWIMEGVFYGHESFDPHQGGDPGDDSDLSHDAGYL